MALFDNVNYQFYSETLGRAIIPNSEEFDALKLENVQTMKRLLPYIEELEENGIDSAVCLMIETDYKNNQLKEGQTAAAIASESLGGHSVSYGSNAVTKQTELDAISTDQAKIKAIKLFCALNIGVC